MELLSSLAIQAVNTGQLTYCKFLSANDTGITGGHQSGVHIAKGSSSILFDRPGEKGELLSRCVKIKWQDDFSTDARFIYYGQKTRNEYRITHFGRGFPFLKPEYTGALFILVKKTDCDYEGFVLNTDSEITDFLDAFGLSPADVNRLIDSSVIVSDEDREKNAIMEFLQTLTSDFPSSEEMSFAARTIQDKVYDHSEYIRTDPDSKLVAWTDTEYRLFRALEQDRYGGTVTQGFSSVDDFVNLANQVLNRRKSRAGKSLEHHLSAIFDGNGLQYASQAVTEGNKRPDFLFPSREAYLSSDYPIEKMLTLAAKTTCKDRWRQILNEADRFRDRPKYLCTLQQGMSPSQMDEMSAEKVILVVPKPFISYYPSNRQQEIWTIHRFVEYAKQLEA